MSRKKKDEKKEKVFKDAKFGSYTFYEELLEEENEKDLQKFIKQIESLVRRSIELRDYIRFLRDELNLNNCYFLSGVNAEDVDIEFHHHPITLFDLVKISINILLSNNNGEEVSSLVIAQQVVEWHYNNLIGLVPLSKTIHELAHSKQIIIPPSAIYGDYIKFIKEYRKFITSEILQKIDEWINVEIDDVIKLNEKILEEKVIFCPNPKLALESNVDEIIMIEHNE